MVRVDSVACVSSFLCIIPLNLALTHSLSPPPFIAFFEPFTTVSSVTFCPVYHSSQHRTHERITHSLPHLSFTHPLFHYFSRSPCYSIPDFLTHSLHSPLVHPLTHSCHSMITLYHSKSLTHSLTYQVLVHSLTLCFTMITQHHSLTHSPIIPLVRPLTISLFHYFTHSLPHSLSYSLAYSPLVHPPTLSLFPSITLWSLYHSLTRPLARRGPKTGLHPQPESSRSRF